MICQTKVWRVEAEDGSGPYDTGAFPSLDGHPDRPASRDDFDPTIYRLMFTLEGLRNKFGFLKPEHAAAWFGSDLDALAQKGYVLRECSARRVWLSKSGKQCWFEPHPGAYNKNDTIWGGMVQSGSIPERSTLRALQWVCLGRT
jgi:hypothetical protein